MKEITDIGPTGKTVAANVKRLREAKNLTFAKLAEAISDNGRDMKPLALRRIEALARRVDVDDLFALAVALDVTPLTLLLPDSGDRAEPVKISGIPSDREVSANVVWLWGLCAEPLTIPDLPGTSGANRAVQRFALNVKPDIDERAVIGAGIGSNATADATAAMSRAVSLQGVAIDGNG